MRVHRNGVWLALVLIGACGSESPPPASGGAPTPAVVGEVESIEAAVVAVGIPGAGAIAEVGVFHPGGPMHDKPEFAAATAPGKVLDPRRLLVASSSNFGAPKALADWAEGSILSIDPYVGGTALVIPPDFAAEGGQAKTLNGAVQVYTAQSEPFLQRHHNPETVTADLPPVSRPLAIVINNAFGRPWFANAPKGFDADGLESITDPDGIPLADPPNEHAGGVSTGTMTNRDPPIKAGGITAGAVATAHMGRSVDDSGFAVFAVVQADGSIAQLHVEQGIDGLVPAGGIGPVDVAAAGRTGAIFNWVPDRILYVADPGHDAVVAVRLRPADGVLEVDNTERFEATALSTPVDLAPAVPEMVSSDISSNATLAGGSDFYVANRGNGTIVRMTQQGRVVATREVTLPGHGALGAGKLNGITVSRDATTLWVTVTGELPGYSGRSGAVLKLPAFGAQVIGASLGSLAGDPDLIAVGEALFRDGVTPEDGLGPLFNGRACADCHLEPGLGGMGTDGLSPVVRVGRLDAAGQFDPMAGRGGPVSRAHSVTELGLDCDLRAGVPAGASITSVRNAPALFGAGLIDRIPDEIIAASAVEPDGDVHGRPNWVIDSHGDRRVGRFGWKAGLATLEDFVADALRTELGVTNPIAPHDLVNTVSSHPGCGSNRGPEDDGTKVTAITAYVASLPAPSRVSAGGRGAEIFAASGCAACHRPVMPTEGDQIWLYSDLLLHDMGGSLDDGTVQGQAGPSDWRTTPLWGLGHRQRLLHDGRARTVTEAILAHQGEGQSAADHFRALIESDQKALLEFLETL